MDPKAIKPIVNPLDGMERDEPAPFAVTGYVFNPMARRDPLAVARQTDGFFENLANAWMLTGIGQAIQKQRDLIETGASVFNRKKNQLSPFAAYEDAPGFNAFEMMDLTAYADHLDAFVDVDSPAEASHVMRMIDKNRERRGEMQLGGASSSAFIAEILNPINLIPLPGAAGMGFVRGAVRVGAGAAAVQVGEEAVASSLDPTRTIEESVIAVGSTAILAGALGGAIGALGPRRNAVARSLMRGNPERPAGSAAPPVAPAAPGAPPMARAAPAERDEVPFSDFDKRGYADDVGDYDVNDPLTAYTSKGKLPDTIFHGTSLGDKGLQPYVDKYGNLVLIPSSNFGGRQYGVSFGVDRGTAAEYAGRPRADEDGNALPNPVVFEIDRRAAGKLKNEAMGELFADGRDVIIPKGRWRVSSEGPGFEVPPQFREFGPGNVRDFNAQSIASLTDELDRLVAERDKRLAVIRDVDSNEPGSVKYEANQRGLWPDEILKELKEADIDETLTLVQLETYLNSPAAAARRTADEAAAVPGTPDVAAGSIRLYRGIGNNMGPAGDTAFFTTNPKKAASYGAVHYIDVPKTRDSLKRFITGHGGADEFVTDAREVIDGVQPYVTSRAAQSPGAEDAARQRRLLGETGQRDPNAAMPNVQESMTVAELAETNALLAPGTAGQSTDTLAARIQEREADARKASAEDGSARLVRTGTGIERALGSWSQWPYYVLKNNPFTEWVGDGLARLADEISGSPGLFTQGNKNGVPTAQSVYALASLWRARRTEAVRAATAVYYRYRGFLEGDTPASDLRNKMDEARDTKALSRVFGDRVGDDLRLWQFRELVSDAMTNGDRAMDNVPAEIAPFVTEAAQVWRKMFSAYETRARELGMFSDGLKKREKTLTRLVARKRDRLAWFDDKLDTVPLNEVNRRAGLERVADDIRREIEFIDNELELIPGKIESAKGSPISKVGGDASYLTRIWRLDLIDADPEGLRAILIEHFRKSGDDDAVIEARADETMGNIRREAQLGTVAPAFNPSPAKARKLDIPTAKVARFIERDIEVIADYYERRMAPAIEMTTKFGDTELTEHIAELVDGIREQAGRAGNEAGVAIIMREAQRQLDAIEDLRAKVLGFYGVPEDPSAWSLRSLEVAKGWAISSQLGLAAQVAIIDPFRVLFAHNIRAFTGALFLRLGRGLEESRIARHEVELLGEVHELITHARLSAATGYQGGSVGRTKVENFVQSMKGWTNVVNMVGPFVDFWKGIHGGLLQSAIVERSLKWMDGTIEQRDKTWLASLGIGEDMAGRIVGQWQAAGAQKGKQLHLADTPSWTDEEVVRTFRAAIFTDLQNSPVTPGPSDRPNFMSKPLWSALLLYKGFALSATQRVLMTAMQQRDRRAMTGILAMVGMGYIVDSLRSGDYKKRHYLAPDRFMRAVELSGVAGIFSDFNNMIETASGNQAGVRPWFGIDATIKDPDWAQRVGSVTGATTTPALNLAWAFGHADASANEQARAVRRLLPFNNLIFWKDFFDGAQRDATTVLEGITD